MLDLETAGKAPGCVVLSIGAVMFDPVAKTVGDEFYRSLDIEHQPGLVIDPGTIKWWMKQSQEARDEAFSGTTPLYIAASDFMTWCSQQNAKYFWAHGAPFDFPIWNTAVAVVTNRLDLIPYADFRTVRDTRTIFDAAGVVYKGHRHHAVKDARDQAGAVIDAYRKLGL